MLFMRKDFLKCSEFWRQHPALLYGLAFLLGCGFTLSQKPIFLLPSIFILAPLLDGFNKGTFIRLSLALLLFLTACTYVSSTIQFPNSSEAKTWDGIAHFDIDHFSLSRKHYGTNWRYTGKVRSFYIDGKRIAKNIPVQIELSSRYEPPKADSSYQIEGLLKEIAPQRFLFSPHKNRPWLPLKSTFSLAQLRFESKKIVSSYIKKHIENPKSANFLIGIATGDFQDRLMSYEFGRFGLQHIMAISGFHFAIVAATLNFLFAIALSRRQSICVVLALLTGYFIFLGCSASVLRAWITTLLVLMGMLIERRTLGLNSLGVALLVILIFDPMLCKNMGFQFSFAATAAILMLYSPLEKLFRIYCPKRSLNQMLKMDRMNQHGYYFLHCSRHAIALMCAVNTVSLPLMLYYFQKFPAMSLLYNLFFPFMVSISMILLMLGMLTGLLWLPIGKFFHYINDYYTNFILGFTSNVPKTFDVFWRVSPIPTEIIMIILCLTFSLGLFFFHQSEKQREEMEDWAFI